MKNWNKMKSHLKYAFPALTNADITQHTGKDEEMIENIMLKIGKTRQELTDFLSNVK
jgi:hypothetical protein